jgi:lipopolysaccharide transport system ATP-binding protein
MPQPTNNPPPRDDVLIRVEGVSKKFCRSLKQSLWYGMKDIGREMLGRTGHTDVLRPGEFWAVNDVSFELRRGECLGLIGRNGAGKTTLLKMLNGLIKPDQGRITMRGRVGALIALGAGFNPILTGRENIYVNGSVLGLTKREIDEKIEEIIDFADIREFIDCPVQSYSSGMQVRLGFAVATALNPDILLLDEVLAVGDAAFRNKCYNRIGKLRHKAATIFVSHTMDQVAQVCDSALVLSHGRPSFLGDLYEGIQAYEQINRATSDSDDVLFQDIALPVTRISFALEKTEILHGEWMNLRMEVHAAEPVPDAILRIVFYDDYQRPFAEWNSDRIGTTFDLTQGKNVFAVRVGPILFKTGKYKIGINLNDHTGVTMLCWSYKQHELDVKSFTRVGPSVALCSSIERLA